MIPEGRGPLRGRRRRRAQTKLESAIALAMFALAFIGAWKLYGPQIRETTQFMIDFFSGGGPQDAADSAQPPRPPHP